MHLTARDRGHPLRGVGKIIEIGATRRFSAVRAKTFYLSV